MRGARRHRRGGRGVLQVAGPSLPLADHRDALALVRQVEPGGADAAKQLERLIALKD